MARTIFLLLVLLNLLAFAWIYLKGDERMDAGREPQRAKSELATDKIRLMTSRGSTLESCHAYAGVTFAEAQEIAKAWSEKLPAAHFAINPIMLQPAFDMIIAGLASRAAAETKLAQLKNLGISEGVQIKSVDDKHFLLLMASFKERSAAEDALKNVVKKGIRSAVIVERKAASAPSTIEIRGGDAILKPLAELASLNKSLVPVACDAARNSP